MNTIPEQIPPKNDTLLSLVDFKWLMAGLGWWVVSRLTLASTGLAL